MTRARLPVLPMGRGGVRASSALPALEGRGMSIEASAEVTDSQLAVLLRQAQWALDDAAHDLPAGRGTAQCRVELAATLQALAAVLRASAPDGTEHCTGACEPNPTQTPADHRLSDPHTPAPGDRPDPA